MCVNWLQWSQNWCTENCVEQRKAFAIYLPEKRKEKAMVSTTTTASATTNIKINIMQVVEVFQKHTYHCSDCRCIWVCVCACAGMWKKLHCIEKYESSSSWSISLRARRAEWSEWQKNKETSGKSFKTKLKSASRSVHHIVSVSLVWFG